MRAMDRRFGILERKDTFFFKGVETVINMASIKPLNGCEKKRSSKWQNMLVSCEQYLKGDIFPFIGYLPSSRHTPRTNFFSLRHKSHKAVAGTDGAAYSPWLYVPMKKSHSWEWTMAQKTMVKFIERRRSMDRVTIPGIRGGVGKKLDQCACEITKETGTNANVLDPHESFHQWREERLSPQPSFFFSLSSSIPPLKLRPWKKKTMRIALEREMMPYVASDEDSAQSSHSNRFSKPRLLITFVPWEKPRLCPEIGKKKESLCNLKTECPLFWANDGALPRDKSWPEWIKWWANYKN